MGNGRWGGRAKDGGPGSGPKGSSSRGHAEIKQLEEDIARHEKEGRTLDLPRLKRRLGQLNAEAGRGQ